MSKRCPIKAAICQFATDSEILASLFQGVKIYAFIPSGGNRRHPEPFPNRLSYIFGIRLSADALQWTGRIRIRMKIGSLLIRKFEWCIILLLVTSHLIAFVRRECCQK